MFRYAGGQYLGRWAGAADPAVGQDVGAVGVRGGQAEVVQHDDHRGPGPRALSHGGQDKLSETAIGHWCTVMAR